MNIYDTVNTRFVAMLTTLPTQEWWIDNLFTHLPNQTWPDSFKMYVATMQDVMPPSSWLPRNKQLKEMVPTMKKIRYFGRKIWESSKELRTFINGRCNPHWKAVNLDKSGSSRSGVLYGIRKYIYEANALDKVHIS
jgi:hypothetical protein